MKQFKLALPIELRAQLDAASAAADRTVADEIRRRLMASFGASEAGDLVEVALNPDTGAKLKAASAAAGRTVAEEVWQRIEKSFAQEEVTKFEPQLLELVGMSTVLTGFVREQTGRGWMDHPETFDLFQRALMGYLRRLKISLPPADESVSSPGELGQPLIPSDNPDIIAAALEALAYFYVGERDTDLFPKKLKEQRLPGVPDFVFSAVQHLRERKS
jgi:hypothetical protein